MFEQKLSEATLQDRAPRRAILCIMNLPPDPNGHGGSQRAWHLVDALRAHGDVHFVLVYSDDHRDCLETSLAPLEPLVRSVTRIRVPAWRAASRKVLGLVHPGVRDFVQLRSLHAPVLRRAVVRDIAGALVAREFDVIFAARLCCAVIAQQLIDAGLLRGGALVTDFDDVQSRFRLTQVREASGNWGRQGRWLGLLDARLLARAERRIARDWQRIGVSSAEDADALRRRFPANRVEAIPNGVAHQALPARTPDGRFKILFVGNLNFAPNKTGLIGFAAACWEALKRDVPQAELTVVGLNPPSEIQELCDRHGFALRANVPSVRPYYADCDVVIAPILFGSGTRIKILEALAYERAVVSTVMGAEGLDLRDGVNALLTEGLGGFSQALRRLAEDAPLRAALAAAGRAHQQLRFGPGAVKDGIARLLG